jgi:hypothetical protein
MIFTQKFSLQILCADNSNNNSSFLLCEICFSNVGFNYFMLSVQRVSCVHTQILEIGQPGNGAVTAVSFFRGQLFAGYSNGIIRVMISSICQNSTQLENPTNVANNLLCDKD